MDSLGLQLRLHNTLTGSVEPFVSLDETSGSKTVKLYVCGPTVYDKAHLGHARCYITWDVLYRLLTCIGYSVTYVRNVTDVDDKILARAGQLGISPAKLAQENYDLFSQDMMGLNVLPPTIEPRATEHITDMLTGIERLIDKGAAYVTADGSVYFDVCKKADYGKLKFTTTDPDVLAGRLADLQSGARVEVDEDKNSPLDFALWKSVSDRTDCGWESPWPDEGSNQSKGWGRPGWHMECSAMNHAIFGDQIDIHAGGADLIFPHHENEIAQSESMTGKHPFARYWMHNGFVNVSGEKMSKSLGNFSTVQDVLARYDANTIRYFLLTHHYRVPVDFTDEALIASKTRVDKLSQWLQEAMHACSVSDKMTHELLLTTATDILQLSDQKSPLSSSCSQAKTHVNKLLTAMVQEDLNTAKALAELNQIVSLLRGESDPDGKLVIFQFAISLFNLLGFNLALLLAPKTIALNIEAVQDAFTRLSLSNMVMPQTAQGVLQAILAERKRARQAKNWNLSDSIRDILLELNFKVLDNKDGSITIEQDGIEVARID